MTATTNPQFDQHTESLEVARRFAENIRGKTILVTGVNCKGIGFATSKAFVSGVGVHWLTRIDMSNRPLNIPPSLS